MQENESPGSGAILVTRNPRPGLRVPALSAEVGRVDLTPFYLELISLRQCYASQKHRE